MHAVQFMSTAPRILQKSHIAKNRNWSVSKVRKTTVLIFFHFYFSLRFIFTSVSDWFVPKFIFIFYLRYRLMFTLIFLTVNDWNLTLGCRSFPCLALLPVLNSIYLTVSFRSSKLINMRLPSLSSTVNLGLWEITPPQFDNDYGY
jgi:hypothetical protein